MRSMSRVSSFTIALALVAGTATLVLVRSEPAVAQVTTNQTQNVLAGARLFGTRGCVTCHAINGLGGTMGPDLARSARPQSFYGFGAAMWNHLPTMVEQMRVLGIERPRLAPWEAADLIAFLFWLDYFEPPGDTTDGKRLFSDKGCLACHQAGGVGGVVGPGLDFLNQYGSPVQIATAMWNHGPAMSDAMREMGIQRPTFSGPELVDLISFLKATSPRLPEASLSILPGRAEEGRRLIAEKSCVKCHSVRGEGGTVGPDLAGAGQGRTIIDFAAAMWNKAPAMARAMEQVGISVPQLKAEEMADLLAYLYSIQYSAESGDPRRGQALLRGKGCLACHAVAGRGGSTAGDLSQAAGLDSQAGVIAALWNHVLIGERPACRELSWPSLGPAEMADLAAFLQTLGRTR